MAKLNAKIKSSDRFKKINDLKKQRRGAIGEVVRNDVMIGQELFALKRELKESGKSWLDEVQKYTGIHPREASRFIRLFTAWGQKIGTEGADQFFARLPDDLKVLERLTAIDVKDVEHLLDENDVTKLDRAKWNALLKPYGPGPTHLQVLTQ